MEDVLSRAEYEAEIKRLDVVRDEALRRQDEENNRQNHRIEVLETKVHDLNKVITSIEKMAVHMENIDREQKKQGERLEALEKRDGEMWRTILSHIATLIVGAVMAYIFSKVGL